MSLLLEALKKAALEKQGKTLSGATNPVTAEDAATGEDSPTTAESQAPSVHIESHFSLPESEPDEPVAEPPSEPPLPSTSESPVVTPPDEPDDEPGFEIEQEPLLDQADEVFTDFLDEEEIADPLQAGEAEHSWDPTLQFDIEIDESMTVPDVPAAVVSTPAVPAQVAEKTPESESPRHVEKAYDQPAIEASEPANVEPESVREDKWINPSELTQTASPQQKSHQTQETVDSPLADSPLVEGTGESPNEVVSEARARAEEEQAAKEEIGRKQKFKAEGRAALEHLVSSGQALERKRKRRARFLYTMLIVTAFGGILSYYFYLLANSNISELQTESGGMVQVRAQNPDIASNPTGSDTDAMALVHNSSTGNNLPSITPAAVPPESDGSRLNSLASTESHSTNVSSALSGTIGQAATSGPKPNVTPTVSVLTPGQSDTANTRTEGTKPAPGVIEYRNKLSNFPALTNTETETQQNQPTRVIVHHQQAPATVSLDIQTGYSALQNKDYATAAAAYERAVVLAPANRDAILGAAAASTALNRIPEALRYYQQQLNLDPNDSHARAAILSLVQGRNTASIKRELDDLLQANPQSAHLHFLKGVTLASANQWSAAQQAFFEAYFRDKRNADYAYNLAVSLDHINQKREAMRYYQLALDSNANNSARFSPEKTRRRLSQLAKLEQIQK